MSPNRILELLYESMTDIILQQRAIQSVVSNQMKNIKERIAAEGGNEDVELGGHRMAFREPFLSNWEFYGKATLTLATARENALKHENRQYQWLLAEAYEEFEIFLMRIYASVGYKTCSFWPAEDYGNFTLPQVDSVDFEKCLKLVRAKSRQQGVGFILSLVRKRIPNFLRLESKNAVSTDLRFHTALIAQLRHHIVHTRGFVADVQNLKQKVLNDIGRWNSGKPRKEDVEFIENFFRYRNDPSEICLVRIPMEDGIFHVDILNAAISTLLAHAYLIATKLEQYIAKENMNTAAARLKARRSSRRR